MDLQAILDMIQEASDDLTETPDLERGRCRALVALGELIGKLTVQVEAEKAFAAAEETEGAPV
jgi:hypothetical protein